MKERSVKHNLYVAVKFAVLAIYLVAIAFPFYWILTTSFKTTDKIFGIPIQYYPFPFTLDNYKLLFSNMDFGHYIVNSVLVSMSAALAATCFAVTGSYVMSRMNFRGKRAIIYYFFITQMLPGFIGLAPLYQILSAWRMIDFLPTLAILGASGLSAYSLITMQGFMAQVPKSLDESAQIDGCNRFQALVYTILPVMLPSLFAVYIFGFVQVWNDLFGPIIYMNRDINYTIPVALNFMVMKNDVRWGELSAGTVISIVPTVIMFSFAQKYLASGLMSGAIKG